MTVRITSQHLGCATASRTRTMLEDVRFYEILVSLTEGAELIDHVVDAATATVRWTQRLLVPDSVPASLRSMLGSHLTLIETQEWTIDSAGAHLAAVEVRPAGLPAQLRGTFHVSTTPIEMMASGILPTSPVSVGTLHAQLPSPSGDGDLARCIVAVDAQVQVSVPFFASKAEAVIADNFTSVLTLRTEAARLYAQ